MIHVIWRSLRGDVIVLIMSAKMRMIFTKMSVNTWADPPGQIENGTVKDDDGAEHDDPDDFHVDVGDRETRRHAADRHRGETGNRGELGQVEDFKAGNLILRTEEQQRREGQHPQVVPVVAFPDAGDDRETDCGAGARFGPER